MVSLKHYFTIATLALCLATNISFGQVCEGLPILSENFTSGVPTDWMVLNLDDMQIYPYMTARGYSSEWIGQNHLTEKCVGVSSRFSSGAQANDYLISPAISIPENESVCLSFKASIGRDQVPEFLDVMVSTSVPTEAAFNQNTLIALSENQLLFNWTTFTVDLSSFEGQTIYIGFRHKSSFGFAVFLDEVRVSRRVATDLAIKKVGMENITYPASSVIKGSLLNGGTNTINSYDLHWKVNNGTTNTANFSSVGLTAGSVLNFEHPIPWVSSDNGTYEIETWVSNCNDNTDDNSTNDLITKTVFVHTFPRRSLIEEFTQASCGPCAFQNPVLDSIIDINRANGKINALKYHTVWPGYDPMYELSAEASNERTAYYQVYGVPLTYFDGVFNLDCNYYPGSPVCITQGYLDSLTQKSSIFELTSSTSTIIGEDLNVTSQIKALTSIPADRFVLHNVLYEDKIDYQSMPPGSNGETVFSQVMRAMAPNAGGQLLPAMQSNEVLTYNYTIPILSDYNTSELRFLSFVQDDSDQKIYQSNDIPTIFSSTTEIDKYSKIKMIPNPASDDLQILLPEGVRNITSVEFCNLLGEEVMRYPITDPISHIKVSSLERGIYMVKFRAQHNVVVVQKLVVSHK